MNACAIQQDSREKNGISQSFQKWYYGINMCLKLREDNNESKKEKFGTLQTLKQNPRVDTQISILLSKWIQSFCQGSHTILARFYIMYWEHHKRAYLSLSLIVCKVRDWQNKFLNSHISWHLCTIFNLLITWSWL